MTSESNYLFSPAEWSAIHLHKYYLSKQAGHEICLKDTVANWMKYYSEKWRKKQQELIEKNGKNPIHERRFSPAEWKALRVHRYFLSQRYHRWVSIEETIEDWQKNYAKIWRQKRMVLSSRNQMEQILAHKWLESQKVHHDIGSAAATDWIKKYADRWRQWWESE
ncbi:MAG: hypothetical protein RAO92_10425 [Candidatus Euphemobacter frigidus]|nr:hypothetical protein [Candidatus Euphemobacter frigidus]MDP8276799.1 hypothetical protein [Candidatus Euphemobacter frigidus]